MGRERTQDNLVDRHRTLFYQKVSNYAPEPEPQLVTHNPAYNPIGPPNPSFSHRSGLNSSGSSPQIDSRLQRMYEHRHGAGIPNQGHTDDMTRALM